MSRPGPSSERDRVVALHRQGRIAEAAAGYETLLAADPDDADLLGLSALALEASGRAADGEARLRRSLEVGGPAPVFLRNLNNLLVMLAEAGRDDEIRALFDRPLPAWPDDRAPDEVERDTLTSLVGLALRLGHRAATVALTRGVMPHLVGDLDLVEAILRDLTESGELAEAARLAGLLPDRPGLAGARIAAMRAVVATATGGADASRPFADTFAARLPILIAPPRPTQTLRIAVLGRRPHTIAQFAPLRAIHFGGNLPEQLSARYPDRYRMHSVLADAPGVDTRILEGEVDLVVNNYVNAELLWVPGMCDQVARLARSFGAPIVNEPVRARGATRVDNSVRLQGLDGIVSPRILFVERGRRSPAQAAEAIADVLGLPVILRVAHSHSGEATWRPETKAELVDLITENSDHSLYAIEYFDLRHGGDIHRGLRVGVVDGAMELLRADYSARWYVRARRNPASKAFYAERPDHLALADALTRDPLGTFGSDFFDRMGKIAERIPLDVFGIDFDVAEDGRIVVFEANATMNLLSTAPDDRHYPQEIERRFVASIDAFYRRRASRA